MKAIAEVERETGIPRATLRIWERRYGFPAPRRDERGERSYPPDQVLLLQRIARLVEQGHRPARLLAGGADEIDRLWAGTQSAAVPPSAHRGSAKLLRLLKGHDVEGAKKELAALLARDGLARFVCAELPALNAAVGAEWLAGALQIHEEHLYCDCVYEVMRPAIARLDSSVRPEAPVAVLTTFTGEAHGLGLLSAHAMLALSGCRTVSLGLQLPLEQIARACGAYGADLVGLSFSGAMPPAQVLRGLQELRGMLPGAVRVWVGGNAPVLGKRRVPGVRIVREADDIPALLAEDFALPPRRSAGVAR
jgi:methylmalonyl-CoA mutase cobalamin-binding subunit